MQQPLLWAVVPKPTLTVYVTEFTEWVTTVVVKSLWGLLSGLLLVRKLFEYPTDTAKFTDHPLDGALELRWDLS